VKRTDQIEMCYKPVRAALNAAGITTPDRQPRPWVLSPDLPMYIEGSATRKLMVELGARLPPTLRS
jgi:hypothetical protein